MAKTAALAGVAAIFVAAPTANADVVISTDPTSNMSCSAGVCAPTATDAVLNVTDLKNLLASGNVEVTTTGSGVQADDIYVKAEISWSNTSTLSLDAYESIRISRVLSLSGPGGLTLQTNDGGSSGALSFVRKGHAVFQHLSSQLIINGVLYTLESTLPSLASAINNNPSGNYALANDYDASADGTYSSSPIATLSGKFSGVGNKISKLKISSSNGTSAVGLFGSVGGGAVVGDLTINVSISGEAYDVGALAGGNAGTIEDSFSSGSEACTALIVGGLVGLNGGGKIISSGSSVAVSSDISSDAAVGGLVGSNYNQAAIGDSFATGSVSATNGYAGGLLGTNSRIKYTSVTGDFATGSVTGGGSTRVGGFVGYNKSRIADSYATGAVTGGTSADVGSFAGYGVHIGRFWTSYATGLLSGGKTVGGFIGRASPRNKIRDAYWNTDTTGITDLRQGAGNIPNFPGITGLTTEQLQAGLPAGFDPSVWAESPDINGGLPYLIANSPNRSIR